MKKYAPYILIFIILVGLFSPMVQVNAQADSPACQAAKAKLVTDQIDKPALVIADQAAAASACATTTQNIATTTGTAPPTSINCTYQTDTGPVTQPLSPSDCTKAGGVEAASTPAPGAAAVAAAPSEFQKYIGDHGCGLGITDHSSLYPGCFIALTYGLFYVVPSWLLYLSAYFFNVLISITLFSKLFAGSTFIPSAWGIVRDLSNIFFILILLYIAVRLILGLGGSESKKMIAKVIIIALLINFSMFFTEVVIDTTNVLALIFYNKLNVNTTNADGSKRAYDAVSGEKIDVAGGMVNSFDATRLVSADFFALAKKHPPVNGKPVADDADVAPGILIGMTIIAGALMFFAAYCFFMAGISFLGRMIELFVLIIFSPFAFMSSTIPLLNDVDYLGWKSWLGRLLKVSFMAPVFMFFMYFIFLLISAKPSLFGNLVDTSKQSLVETILLVIIPALIVLILLLKATDFAKKGGGKIGEVIMTGAKMAGGLAIGAATGGAALLGTGIIGGQASRVANDDELRRKAAGGEGVTEKEQRGAQRRLTLANSLSKSSFDFRQTGVGKFAAKKSGMDFNQGTAALGVGADKFKGGRAGQIERKGEEQQKTQKSYELIGREAIEKQSLRKAKYEDDLAQEKARPRGSAERAFDEKKFKSDYEAGKYMAIGGKTVKVEPGSVGTPKEVNDYRRTAYANSLDTEAEKEKARGAVKTFFNDWYEGSKKMAATPGGLATTAAVGVATGGIGVIGAVVGGGFISALKQSLNVRATNPQVVAAVRKGEDPNKKLVDELKKMTAGGQSDSAKLSEVAKKMTGGGTTANPTPPPATPPSGPVH
jgi:hypothetical protein